jgi:hypothetical protein
MKIIVVAALSLFAGLAQATQVLDIPVQTFDVVRDQPSPPRWEEYSGIPHDKAVAAIKAAEKAGGACHEIAEHQLLVCFYAAQQPKQVGIDWEKAGQAMSSDAGQQSNIEVHW